MVSISHSSPAHASAVAPRCSLRTVVRRFSPRHTLWSGLFLRLGPGLQLAGGQPSAVYQPRDPPSPDRSHCLQGVDSGHPVFKKGPVGEARTCAARWAVFPIGGSAHRRRCSLLRWLRGWRCLQILAGFLWVLDPAGQLLYRLDAPQAEVTVVWLGGVNLFQLSVVYKDVLCAMSKRCACVRWENISHAHFFFFKVTFQYFRSCQIMAPFFSPPANPGGPSACASPSHLCFLHPDFWPSFLMGINHFFLPGQITRRYTSEIIILLQNWI